MQQPNILFVISDQERDRRWLPRSVRLPWRERLAAEGLTLGNHYTHSSPCSPSRTTMHTGLHVPDHGVPRQHGVPLARLARPAVPTIGSVLRAAGYRSSYIGKWHLSYGPTPPMEAYGYSDWEGNDQHFMGWAGTGVHFDPVIAPNAAQWLDRNATTLDQPWFLTVALVNPHDVMWYPIDQPGYQAEHPDELAVARELLAASRVDGRRRAAGLRRGLPEVVDRLPENFGDDLISKPACQRQWRWDQQHGIWGFVDPSDRRAWLRHLDYYVRLHELADESLGTVLAALEASGAWDDTIVVFTSDHGDMCGSHGLRSKGPFVYDEIMKVPAFVRAPGVTSRGCHDVGADQPRRPGPDHLRPGRRRARPGDAGRRPRPGAGRPRGLGAGPGPVLPRHRPHGEHPHHPLADPGQRSTAATSTPATSAWAAGCRTTTCRAGPHRCSTAPTPPSRTTSTSCTTSGGPHELVNLAHDPARRAELRARFDALRRWRPPSSPAPADRPPSRFGAGPTAGYGGPLDGGVAEWLRQGPAKPCTGVRFIDEPV